MLGKGINHKMQLFQCTIKIEAQHDTNQQGCALEEALRDTLFNPLTAPSPTYLGAGQALSTSKVMASKASNNVLCCCCITVWYSASLTMVWVSHPFHSVILSVIDCGLGLTPLSQCDTQHHWLWSGSHTSVTVWYSASLTVAWVSHLCHSVILSVIDCGLGLTPLSQCDTHWLWSGSHTSSYSASLTVVWVSHLCHSVILSVIDYGLGLTPLSQSNLRKFDRV